jgi:hypothetical protein
MVHRKKLSAELPKLPGDNATPQIVGAADLKRVIDMRAPKESTSHCLRARMPCDLTKSVLASA